LVTLNDILSAERVDETHLQLAAHIVGPTSTLTQIVVLMQFMRNAGKNPVAFQLGNDKFVVLDLNMEFKSVSPTELIQSRQSPPD